MDPTHQWAFLWEVRKQSDFAIGAYRAITLEPSSTDPWAHIQLFLGAAGNISKILWGVGTGARARQRTDRRRSLRSVLGVTDESPLRSRTIRDHFEHVDERIDGWWEASQRAGGGSMINYNDAPIDALRRVLPDLRDEELFRHFDRATGVVRFWGDEYDLARVAEEIERIGRAAEKAIIRYESGVES